jgi:hypothetical protein
MRYLTSNVRASVAILYPVCRWLSGRRRVTFAEINAALRPESIATSDVNDLISSIRVGEDIGLLQRFGADRAPIDRVDWALEESVQSQYSDWYGDPIRFRVLVRRKLLAKAVDDITEKKDPSDVAVGLAWLLAQDPARPLPQSYGGTWRSDGASPERVLADQKLKEKYLDTGEQWLGFHRWAVALGCAEYSRAGRRSLILPDPTAALAEELPSIPKDGMPARDFYDAVTNELPILSGGRIAIFMRSVRGEYVDSHGDVSVGSAFSFALHRLKAQGVLGLHEEHDASHRVDGVLHGQSWVFDRVTREGGNGHE